MGEWQVRSWRVVSPQEVYHSRTHEEYQRPVADLRDPGMTLSGVMDPVRFRKYIQARERVHAPWSSDESKQFELLLTRYPNPTSISWAEIASQLPTHRTKEDLQFYYHKLCYDLDQIIAGPAHTTPPTRPRQAVFRSTTGRVDGYSYQGRGLAVKEYLLIEWNTDGPRDSRDIPRGLSKQTSCPLLPSHVSTSSSKLGYRMTHSHLFNVKTLKKRTIARTATPPVRNDNLRHPASSYCPPTKPTNHNGDNNLFFSAESFQACTTQDRVPTNRNARRNDLRSLIIESRRSKLPVAQSREKIVQKPDSITVEPLDTFYLQGAIYPKSPQD